MTLPRNLLIIGAGGHGKVVADIAEESNLWEKIAFIDDAYPQKKTNGAWSIIGKTSNLSTFTTEYLDAFVAIGHAKTRKTLLEKLSKIGFHTPTIIHHTASISRHTKIGQGCVIMPKVVINVDSIIGDGVIINTAATVDHDCIIEDFVHLAPGVHLSGSVHVGYETWLGTGTSCIQGIHIQHQTMIGAGSVVIKNLPHNITAVGVPASIIKSYPK